MNGEIILIKLYPIRKYTLYMNLDLNKSLKCSSKHVCFVDVSLCFSNSKLFFIIIELYIIKK